MSAGLCVTDLFALGRALLMPHLPSSRTFIQLRFGVPSCWTPPKNGGIRHEHLSWCCTRCCRRVHAGHHVSADPRRPRGPVKPASPERGRSEAQRLDGTEGRPTIGRRDGRRGCHCVAVMRETVGEARLREKGRSVRAHRAHLRLSAWARRAEASACATSVAGGST